MSFIQNIFVVKLQTEKTFFTNSVQVKKFEVMEKAGKYWLLDSCCKLNKTWSIMLLLTTSFVFWEKKLLLSRVCIHCTQVLTWFENSQVSSQKYRSQITIIFWMYSSNSFLKVQISISIYDHYMKINKFNNFAIHIYTHTSFVRTILAIFVVLFKDNKLNGPSSVFSYTFYNSWRFIKKLRKIMLTD